MKGNEGRDIDIGLMENERGELSTGTKDTK